MKKNSLPITSREVDSDDCERMSQKKVLGTRMKQRRITGRSCSKISSSTVLIALILAGLSSIKVISSCVISPSESVAIVGDLSSFSCNARPNNQQRGSISYIRLGSDEASGTYIFRPPVYGPGGHIITRQHLADGYSLSYLDDIHSKVTIQINETQLKHGGQYFCSCFEKTSTLVAANFTVLDELSFVRIGDEVLTPGTLVDLNCSVSFNGSTSSAFIDLTISDANGTEVATERNLSLTKNFTGHYVIHRKVVADPKEEQRFMCEVKVWNKSSTGESPLRSMTSNFSLNWDLTTTSTHYSTSIASQTTTRIAFIAVFVGGVFTGLLMSVALNCIYKKCRTRKNGTVHVQSVGKRSPNANQDIRHEDANLSIQHPPHMKPPHNSAQPHYELIDKEIVGSKHKYEELILNDQSVQTGQYINVIP